MSPTPKTQNPILGIYTATKLQDPSRLLRLAELVWKISVHKYVRGARAKTSTGTCKNLVREANFRNSHTAVHNTAARTRNRTHFPGRGPSEPPPTRLILR